MKPPLGETPGSASWSREPTSEEQAAIDHLVETGQFTPDSAQRMVQGPPISPDAPTPKRSRAQRHTGHVHDFTGRPDEFRGGPAPAAPGFKRSYSQGIAAVRAELAQARLSHPSAIKAEAVKESLNEIGKANTAHAAYEIFAEDDTSDPRREHLGRYRDGDHAYDLEARHRQAALEASARACGACAITDCIFRDNNPLFVRAYSDTKARTRLRTAMDKAAKSGVDFDCAVPLKTK